MTIDGYIELPKDKNGEHIYPGDIIYLEWNQKKRLVQAITYWPDGDITVHCDEGGGFVIDDDFKRDPLAKFYRIGMEWGPHGNLRY